MAATRPRRACGGGAAAGARAATAAAVSAAPRRPRTTPCPQEQRAAPWPAAAPRQACLHGRRARGAVALAAEPARQGRASDGAGPRAPRGGAPRAPAPGSGGRTRRPPVPPPVDGGGAGAAGGAAPARAPAPAPEQQRAAPAPPPPLAEGALLAPRRRAPPGAAPGPPPVLKGDLALPGGPRWSALRRHVHGAGADPRLASIRAVVIVEGTQDQLAVAKAVNAPVGCRRPCLRGGCKQHCSVAALSRARRPGWR
jgi:hypothetical protein